MTGGDSIIVGHNIFNIELLIGITEDNRYLKKAELIIGEGAAGK
mgnify:CR=1 FL=1